MVHLEPMDARGPISDQAKPSEQTGERVSAPGLQSERALQLAAQLKLWHLNESVAHSSDRFVSNCTKGEC